jgi:putative transposase
VRFIDEHKDRRTDSGDSQGVERGLRWGVEPICEVLTEHNLAIAPATYYAAKTRPASARRRRDEQLKPVIADLHEVNYGVYGVRKMHAALHRDGVQVGRDQTARLMRELGLAGVRRGRPKRTTIRDQAAQRPADLVNREFRAERPDRLWVCDLTYIRTWAGFAYLALVIDVFSRRIVGWALATHLRAELPLEALELAIWTRQQDRLDGLIHHTDAGAQYLAIRYAETLAATGALASVGTAGDSYDNALAESTIGQLKAELIHRRGPWRTVEQLEFALFEYLDWWNHRRLHSEIGMTTPVEKETAYAQTRPPARAGSQ